MENVRDMMLEDSKDLLDDVEVTTVAQECVKLKQNICTQINLTIVQQQ